MDAKHIEFFRCTVYGSTAHLFNNAHSMVWINDLLSYAEIHITSGIINYTRKPDFDQKPKAAKRGCGIAVDGPVDSEGVLGLLFATASLLKHSDKAEVAELADARDSKSRAPCGHEGSTPSFGTNRINSLDRIHPR